MQTPDYEPANGAIILKNRLLAFGIGGSGFAALCCFTPFLAWILAISGLSSALGFLYSDAVLFPALGVFLLITGYALWRRKQKA
jgi:mercuric ion transport protein